VVTCQTFFAKPYLTAAHSDSYCQILATSAKCISGSHGGECEDDNSPPDCHLQQSMFSYIREMFFIVESDTVGTLHNKKLSTRSSPMCFVLPAYTLAGVLHALA
jgi:hypothetical protein